MSTAIAKTGGALAVLPDQTDWTPQQQAVLRQSGISDQVAAAELSGFLHLCQRTQLDPFSRQIYLIGRYDKRAGREVFTPQTGIDGYRVVAHRVVAASSQNFGYEDTQWCDASGRWRDVWLSDAPPAAARVTVLRNGQRFPAIAVFREYVQTNRDGKPIGLWGKMPAGQLAKCAEALALRKAFPHDLAGVYTAEEMAQADNTATAPHLRSVPASEPDPWTAPAPEVQEATPAVEPHRPAQDIADQAETATSRERISQLWSLAKTGRLMEAPVLAADTKEIGQLGQYLTRRAKHFAEAAQADDGVVDVEIVPDAPLDEHAAAVAELRAYAASVGLDDIDRDAHGALGVPLTEASAGAIRNLTAQLRGTAA